MNTFCLSLQFSLSVKNLAGRFSSEWNFPVLKTPFFARDFLDNGSVCQLRICVCLSGVLIHPTGPPAYTCLSVSLSYLSLSLQCLRFSCFPFLSALISLTSNPVWVWYRKDCPKLAFFLAKYGFLHQQKFKRHLH